MSDPEYTVKLNLYWAEEGGYETGHANVTVIRTDENGDDTEYTFGVNSTGGNVGTWINPYSQEQDGRIGEDSPWTPDNPIIPDGGVVSSEIPISEADYQDILDFIEPYTGSDYSGNSPTNYDVLASLNPMSPDDSWSCYSFVQSIYEMVGGEGSSFVDEFSNEQLDQLTDNYIETLYGDLDAGRNMDNMAEYLEGIADDYGWAFDNPGAVFNEFLPQWMQDLIDDWVDAENAPPPTPVSPLVLDLDGQGIDLVSVLGADAVYWDIDQDGFAEKSGWISGNNGLLAIDLNSDGIINDHGELFGTDTVDGFTVLSAYDSNVDNVIDVNDAQFADLLVWVDANSDGYSQSGELFSLTDLGITSINLNASLVDYDIAGNHVTHESTFTINGQTQTIVDAWFAYDNTNSHYQESYTLDVRTFYLPTLRGFGDVKDLHIAMSMDETLLLMVQEIANSGDALLFDPAFDLNGKMEAVLYRWAGVDGVDPASRGAHVDARQLEFLEQYLGDSFDHNSGNTPTVGAGGLATGVFVSALSTLSSHILIQTSASSFFGEDTYYDFALGKIENSSLDGIYFLTPNQIMNQTTDTSNAYVISDINSSYEISENNGGGYDEIWIQGVQESDLRLVKSGLNLEINIGNETITVVNQFKSDNNQDGSFDYFRVENIVLDDGTKIDLLNDLTFTGTSGNDVLVGLHIDDTLIGAEGDDELRGNEGNDTYVWSVGDGNDTIREFMGSDTLVLHGVQESELRLEHISNGSLIVHIGNELITIENQFWANTHTTSSNNTRYEVETIILDDGTVLDLTQGITFTGTENDDVIRSSFGNDVLVGNAGNDILLGDNGDDTLIGGTGDDELRGGYENNTFIWSIGDGNDTIQESGGSDTLILHGVQQSGVSFVQSGNNLSINIGSETITVENHFLTHNDYKVENVAFDDGSVISLQVFLNVAPTAQDDAFIGDQDLSLSGNVLVNNGSGLDNDPDGNTLGVVAGTYASLHGSVVVSANGDFTYTPTAGYNGADSFTYTLDDGFGGSDTATVNITVRPPNVAPFAQDDAFTGDEDISITGNLLSDNGNGVDTDPDSDPITVVAETFATTNGSVVISASGSFTYTPNAAYVGADSFTYTLQDDRGGSDIGTANITVNALANNPNAINGTSANDTLNGDPNGMSNDTLIGYGGADILNGKLGNDSYVWSVGDGNDIINETGGVDQLVLHGVIASDIGFEYMSDGSLKLHIGSEEITVGYHFYSDKYSSSYYDTYHVESILLDDGSTIDLLNNITLTGTANSETIDGLNAATTFVGEAGNDILNGKLGNDSYVWSVGDGNDTINETGGVDQLVLHGVLASDLRFENMLDGSLKVHIGSEAITVNYHFYSDKYSSSYYDTYHVESILLDDGSMIDLLNNLTFTGTASGETINGLNANDILFGLDGADTLNGNNGNDALHGGDGSDYLYGNAGDDVLYGGAGVDMLYGQAGADTFVFESSTAFTASDNIQDFNLSDGDKLDVSDLLIGYDPLTDAISDFVQITESGSNSYLSVDADGGADNFVQVAYIYNETGLTDEDALETSGNLIAA
ncbi:MAG: hypothetical protein COB36_11180 [Alphaproteobacteria bacterium]|nr:MAG: hypothetical protein COB36_11180 [Alphaproteobacteria bacterium]